MYNLTYLGDAAPPSFVDNILSFAKQSASIAQPFISKPAAPAPARVVAAAPAPAKSAIGMGTIAIIAGGVGLLLIVMMSRGGRR